MCTEPGCPLLDGTAVHYVLVDSTHSAACLDTPLWWHIDAWIWRYSSVLRTMLTLITAVHLVSWP